VALDSAQAGVIAGSGSTGQDDGVGIIAAFGAPFGLALDNGGKFLFIADRGSNLVRRMDTNTLLVVTVAGTGAAGWSSSVSSVEAMVSAPSGLCINRNTNVMYITGDHSVSFVFKSKTMTSSATIRLKRTPTLGRGQTRAPTGGNTDQGSSAPAAAGISVVAVATATPPPPVPCRCVIPAFQSVCDFERAPCSTYSIVPGPSGLASPNTTSTTLIPLSP
jgi:hypothetical protein